MKFNIIHSAPKYAKYMKDTKSNKYKCCLKRISGIKQKASGKPLAFIIKATI